MTLKYLKMKGFFFFFNIFILNKEMLFLIFAFYFQWCLF